MREKAPDPVTDPVLGGAPRTERTRAALRGSEGRQASSRYWICGRSRWVYGCLEGIDRGGGVMDNPFWGTVSLALLGTLVGVLVLMITEDVQRAMTQRRH